MDITAFALWADVITAAAAAGNAAWLLRQSQIETPERRTGALTLAALNAGIALQACASLALHAGAAAVAPAAWALSRALLLGATLALSALIVRRVR